MFFGKGKEKLVSAVQAPIPVANVTVVATQEPQSWIITNPIAEFLLMNTLGIQFLCLFGYVMIHGG